MRGSQVRRSACPWRRSAHPQRKLRFPGPHPYPSGGFGNKSEFVDAVADHTGFTKDDAKRAVDAIFGTDDGVIARELERRKQVQVTGFGTFNAKSRKARMGRNPRTGEEIKIAATFTPSFRAGTGLKDAVKP